MADAVSEAADRAFGSCLGLTIEYLFGLLELIRRITDVGQTLDGPGRSRGPGAGVAHPGGVGIIVPPAKAIVENMGCDL